MSNDQKVRGDRLVLALVSCFRTLAVELDRRGAIDVRDLISSLESIAAGHRESGDPHQLADAIHMIAQHLSESDLN